MALSVYDIKRIIHPQKKGAAPVDDFRIVDSWTEYNEGGSDVNKRKLEYLCYELETIDPDTGKTIHYFKAIKFCRVQRLPKSAKQSTSLMDMQSQILAGAHENGYNLITVIANVIKPKALGLLYLYGVQGIADNIGDAKKKAHEDYIGYTTMLQGTYRVLEMRTMFAEEAEWLREKMYTMEYMTAIRGIPKASDSGEDAGNKGMGGKNMNPDSQGTLEELIAGMSDYEYVLEVLSTPVFYSTLRDWQRKTQADMTTWNSQLQGTKSFNLSMSVPMMFSSNQSTSQGWNKGYSDARSVSFSKGESFSVGQNQSQSHGISESFSQSFGRSSGVNVSESNGISHSVSSGSSASSNYGQNIGQSTNIGISKGSSVNVGNSQGVSLSTSQGSTVGKSFGISQGESYGFNRGENVSVNEGGNYSEGMNISQSASESSSASRSDGWNQGGSASGGYTMGASWGVGSSIGGGNSSGENFGLSATPVGVGLNGAWNSGESSNWSNSSNTGGSFSANASESANWGESHSTNVGWGLSTSTGTGESFSSGRSWGQSQGVSAGESWGVNIGNNQSQSVSQNQSESYGQNLSNSTSYGQNASSSNSYGITSGTSVGKSVSVTSSESMGTTQSRSVGQSYGESATEGSSKGTSDTYTQGTSQSQGVNNSQSEGRNTGSSFGSSGAYVQGISSSMGLSSGIGYSKSYQWLDQTVKDILELLEYENERIKKALRGNGAFYTYVYLGCSTKDALAAAQAVAKATWQNEYAMTNPLQVLELSDEEQKHLLYRFAGFSSDVTKETVGGVEMYRYATVLLPNEYVAYTHLPRISEGGVFADVNDIPKFAVPSLMKGEIYMGTIVSAERFTMNNGYLTPFDYRLDESELMHGYFTGASRSGKTVAAMRFIAELAQIKRKKTGKRLRIVCMDPKHDWRTLARFVEPERFRFYSLGNALFHPIKLNPLKIPKGIQPQVWIDGLIDIYCRAYGLLERGKQMMGETIYSLYEDAGVFEACNYPDWADRVHELSAEVTFAKVYERMNKIKVSLEDPTNPKGRAGNDTRDAYARLLDRLQAFERPYSIEHKLFATSEGLAVDELIGEDDVTIFESEGLENTFQNFIFGVITSGFYKYAKCHEGGFLAENQYETVLVIEEANQVLTGNDAAGTGGGAQFGMTGQSEFEQILDQSAGYGLFIIAITQKISMMPSSVIANSGLIFAGRLKNLEDIQVVVAAIGRDPRINDKDVVMWFPKSPTGWFICMSSRTFDYKDSEPIMVAISPLNMAPPSNAEIEEILCNKRIAKHLNKSKQTPAA